jgi:MFS family permease
MINETGTIIKKSSLFTLYILGFTLSLRLAIPTYITSSFLDSFVGEKLVGYVYILGSVFTLTLFYFISDILKKIGNRKTTLWLALISFASLIVVVFSHNIYYIIIFLNISSATATMVAFCLDIFVEHDSTNITVGNIRGIYLTILNTAWLISPFLAGLIVGIDDYRKVFLVSALFMFLLFITVSFSLKDFNDPVYKEFPIWKTVKELTRRRNVRFIIVVFFLLQFFYSWMVIYTPIYLYSHIGLDWFTIGKIFTIMLLPFVLIQAPLGKLADGGMGEKKTLIAGFFIMAFSTFSIPFITDSSFWVWSIVLFVTRIGAAMVEVMSDTYFFKRIGERDSNLISLYRSMTPLVYIIGPIVAGIILLLGFGIPTLFYVLSFLMLLGLRYSLSIRDIL